MIVEELYHSVQNLEKSTILEVPTKVISEATDVLAIAAKMGVKVEWTVKTLDEIAAKRDHFVLLQEVHKLRRKIEVLACKKK